MALCLTLCSILDLRETEVQDGPGGRDVDTTKGSPADRTNNSLTHMQHDNIHVYKYGTVNVLRQSRILYTLVT